MTDKTLREKINDRIAVNPQSGCWEWTKSINHGYGIIHINVENRKKQMPRRAHRVVYEEYVGKIKDGMVICHKCDNKKCVNPEHLFASTQKGNMIDKVKKGRAHSQRGELNGLSKLSSRDVLIAKELRVKGSTYRELAKKFNVSPFTISKAVRGESWAHLSEKEAKYDELFCKSCSKKFNKKRAAQKFCSFECRNESYKIKKDIDMKKQNIELRDQIAIAAMQGEVTQWGLTTDSDHIKDVIQNCFKYADEFLKQKEVKKDE